jgi:hypothetical protein
MGIGTTINRYDRIVGQQIAQRADDHLGSKWRSNRILDPGDQRISIRHASLRLGQEVTVGLPL